MLHHPTAISSLRAGNEIQIRQLQEQIARLAETNIDSTVDNIKQRWAIKEVILNGLAASYVANNYDIDKREIENQSRRVLEGLTTVLNTIIAHKVEDKWYQEIIRRVVIDRQNISYVAAEFGFNEHAVDSFLSQTLPLLINGCCSWTNFWE